MTPSGPTSIAAHCQTAFVRIASRDFSPGPHSSARPAERRFGDTMIASTALVLAQAAAPAGGLQGFLAAEGPFVLLIPMVVLYFVMIIRPQQKRAKEHLARVGAIKRGDTVVLTSGLLGKVVRVEDTEIGLEIAQNVTVKVVKAMINDVRTRGEPAANDPKS
jgi:preprotein translocase subunit YajC